MYGPDATFAGVAPADLAEPATYAGAGAVIVGAPFDGGTSHRPGCRFGPQAIRLTDYLPHDGQRPHLALGVDPLVELGVVDVGDVEMLPGEIEASLEKLERAVEQVARSGSIPVVLGGDHTVALPDVTGVAHHVGWGRVSVIHFDAHADTADTQFGSMYGHGTPMRRLIESGATRGDRFLQIGLRGYWPGPDTLSWMAEQGMRSFEMTEIEARGLPSCLTKHSPSPPTTVTPPSSRSTSTSSIRVPRPARGRPSREAFPAASSSTRYAAPRWSYPWPASTSSRCRRPTTTPRSPHTWPTVWSSKRCRASPGADAPPRATTRADPKTPCSTDGVPRPDPRAP